MLLVKNKLKKKRTIDDDEYLNYLKFSHLDSHLYTSKRTHINKENEIELNNNLEIANIEPKKVHTANKGVDTGNDFVEVIPPYASFMHSEDFDRNEKMVQVWTKMFKENLTPSPPSSSSSSSNGSHGFMSKTVGRGFRLAEFALNTAIAGANVAEFLWNATSPTEYDINAEIDEEEDEEAPPLTTEQPSSSTDNPSHRDRSRSHDSDLDNDIGHRLLRRGASRSRSSTPKGYPRKKSK